MPPTHEKRRSGRVAAAPSFGAGLSMALYYATALIVVVIGSWYVYATFIAPAIISSGGAPSVVSGSTSNGLGEIWIRYSLLITVSVLMFMIVLAGGELMLRTGPKQPWTVATQDQAQPAVVQHEVTFERAGQSEGQPLATHHEVQPLTQTLTVGQKRSQPIVTQPQTQTRLVYCIYCGNKIPSTAVLCNKCGKGQE